MSKRSTVCHSLSVSCFLAIGRLLPVFLFTLFVSCSLAPAQQSTGPIYGIGGYDLASSADQVIAFDYNSSGKADHLVLYRPGTGVVWIIGNTNGTFGPVYASSDGIGSYDFQSPNDRMFALDYNSTGHLDHLVCYRPGSGVIYILANNGGVFSPVYQSNSGISGFDLMSTSDIGFAYDVYGSGRYDSMVFYRPGTGVAFVLNNTIQMTGGFTPTFVSGYNGGGFSKFDLTSADDRLLPYPIPGEMGASDLIGYRPGAQLASFILGTGSSFNSEYLSTSGIGGYDLGSPSDQIVSFDYSDSGAPDHLVVYRPGSGLIWILQFVGPIESPTFFGAVYEGFGGIGGFDLLSGVDRVIGFDYDSSGYTDHLLIYRPGTGVVWILKNTNGAFSPVYASDYLPPGYPNEPVLASAR